MNSHSRNDIKLNLVQTKAIEWNEGPLLVLAVPGSGKTTVLGYRIRRLLENKLNENSKILAITYTNKAVAQMKKIIGDKFIDNERLFISTFHSFCADVLRNHGKFVGVQPNFTIYLDEDIAELLKDIYFNLKDNYEIEENHEVTNFLPLIRLLQNKLTLPDQPRFVFFKDLSIRKLMEKVYPRYYEALQEQNALDFNSLLLKTYELFERFPSIAKLYRMTYRYVCIDEFHDITPWQYEIIKHIIKAPNGNLFVVADDDQALYQWLGGEKKLINKFQQEYNAKTVFFPDNYRCPTQVVKMANNLIQHNLQRMNKPITLSNLSDQPDNVLIFEAESMDKELQWIAQNVKNLYEKNNKNTIAILTPQRRFIDSIKKQINKLGIPVKVNSPNISSQYESVPLLWMIDLLKLTNKRNNRKILIELAKRTSYLIRTFTTDLNEVIAYRDAIDGDLLRGYYYELEKNNISQELLDSLLYDLIEGKSFLNFIDKAMQWFELFNIPSSTMEGINYIYENEKKSWFEFVERTKNAHGDKLTLGVFLQELTLNNKNPDYREPGVYCLTIHESQGMEFDNVYVMGLAEGILPARFGELEDERRKCYVAITRCKESLSLSYSKSYMGRTNVQTEKSRFIKEMYINN